MVTFPFITSSFIKVYIWFICALNESVGMIDFFYGKTSLLALFHSLLMLSSFDRVTMNVIEYYKIQV